MTDELYWNTVKPKLKDALTILMGNDLFASFRLVGGTSLSLQLGHRMSDDIDLFTDSPYSSIDFNAIDLFLRAALRYVSAPTDSMVAMGRSYLVGENEQNAIKLDLYYTDTFIQPALEIGPYRLATVEEIAAMKIDIVQRGARKKDFWDIHEMMDTLSINEMISLHEKRYPYIHDRDLIVKNFKDFSLADGGFDPVCLKGKHWEMIKLDIETKVAAISE